MEWVELIEIVVINQQHLNNNYSLKNNDLSVVVFFFKLKYLFSSIYVYFICKRSYIVCFASSLILGSHFNLLLLKAISQLPYLLSNLKNNHNIIRNCRQICIFEAQKTMNSIELNPLKQIKL